MLTRITTAILLLILLVPTGCSEMSDRDKASESVLVEAPDATPSMTPAELARRFRAAYAQGIKLVQQGQYGLALGAFEQAVALKPMSSEALFNLGACYEAIGDPPRAINIYRRVLALTPNDADCYANLGTSFIKMYYRDKSPVWRRMAREAWQHSLELNPGQADVRAFVAKSESLD